MKESVYTGDRVMSENKRVSKISRKTKETDITIEIDLDGTGKADVTTGIGFLDHMLDSFARHGLFDLKVRAVGDIHVDSHHLIEDTGIVLGEAIREAVGDKKGIKRYGYFILPMDDALVLSAVDLSDRPYLVFDVRFSTPSMGDYDTQMVREFFYAVSYSARMNLHLRQLSGDNDHHICEACYKSFAKALMGAVEKNPRIDDVLSTKGKI